MNHTLATTPGCPVAGGKPIRADLVSQLRRTMPDTASGELRAHLQQDAYVYLPAFFPREDIMAARQAVFERLAGVGEIAAPPIAGIFTGRSERDSLVESRGQFWREVSETWALRRISHGARLHGLMSDLLGERACAQDYLFLRPAGPGKKTHIHCDAPFFTRLTDQVLTAWVALGDVPLRQGPLFVLQDSHLNQSLRETFKGFDVARDTNRKAAIALSPEAFVEHHGGKVLTNDFGAGDVVVFDMHLFHGALDNVSETGETRLSCDVRYQPASAPRDPRYFGPNPGGTTGAGYGELVGARPMTEDWHTR